MSSLKEVWNLFLVAALYLALSSCAPAVRENVSIASETDSSPRTSSYVGQVQGSDMFIAVVVHGGKALAYICDGLQVAEWFRGMETETGLFELRSSAGWELEAHLDNSGVKGKFVVEEGLPLAFTAAPASGAAGLYRAEIEIEGTEHVGGWVVDNRGEQRGAMIGGGTFRRASKVNPMTLQVRVQGLKPLTAFRVTPDYVDLVVKP